MDDIPSRGAARKSRERLPELQIFQHADYWRELATFTPQAVGFSVNYLANVPEVIDLAKEIRPVH